MVTYSNRLSNHLHHNQDQIRRYPSINSKSLLGETLILRSSLNNNSHSSITLLKCHQYRRIRRKLGCTHQDWPRSILTLLLAKTNSRQCLNNSSLTSKDHNNLNSNNNSSRCNNSIVYLHQQLKEVPILQLHLQVVMTSVSLRKTLLGCVSCFNRLKMKLIESYKALITFKKSTRNHSSSSVSNNKKRDKTLRKLSAAELSKKSLWMLPLYQLCHSRTTISTSKWWWICLGSLDRQLQLSNIPLSLVLSCLSVSPSLRTHQ